MQNMDFWFFWDIFRKKWKMILFVAFLAGTAVGVYSKLFIALQAFGLPQYSRSSASHAMEMFRPRNSRLTITFETPSRRTTITS